MGISMKFLKKKSDQPDNSGQLKKTPKKFKWKKLIKGAVVIIVLVLIVSVVYNRFLANQIKKADSEEVVQTAEVETRDIQNVLSSSGSIEPLNTYEVKTLVEGEVISANFEEGDQVEEGDVLYQITTDDLDSKIETGETAVTRAEESYDKAKENYSKAMKKYNEALADFEEASEDYSDLTIKSTASGIVKTISVEEGDTIQQGSEIASIYDNSSMLLEVPFNSSEAVSSLIGKTAQVEITDSNETLEGKVTKVSKIEEVLSGNQVVKTVTIQVENPGGLTASTTATASIGDLYSSSEGTFSVLEDTVITADKSGEIASLGIEEGDRISKGNIVIILAGDTYDDQLKTYQNAVETAEDSVGDAEDAIEDAEESIEDAESDLEDIIDEKTDYSITAPISGLIISKDALVGDTISSNSESALCIIYDLSAVTFEMYVDELDVMEVKEGQEVNVTADALEEAEISGIVTNISLASTTSGGVTQYPVTVKITEVGDLLPGMNVTGEIVIDEVTGVLAVPSDSLMRGDVVYVADSTVKEAVGDVPAGFKEVQVETGLTDGDYIEITSGLSGGEEVYVARAETSEETIMMPGGDMPSGGGDMPSGSGGGGGGMPSGGGGGSSRP